MIYWNVVQQNAEGLLADGGFSVLSRQPVSSADGLDERPGVLLQMFDERLFSAQDTRHLNKLLISGSQASTCGWYKELLRNADFPVPALGEFRTYVKTTEFARRELAEYLNVNLPVLLDRISSDRTGHFGSRSTDLWRRLELTRKDLIEEGGRQSLDVHPVRWGSAPNISGAGLLVVRDRHDDVIFVDDAVDIPSAYLAHARKTGLSVLRQRVGERYLGKTLRTSPAGELSFSQTEEIEVSAFLKSCTVAFCSVRLGRAELSEDLIERLRPDLNDYRGNRPYERRREFHQPKHRRHFIWG